MVSPSPRRRLRVGDVLRVEEPDYRYGRGPLVLRVTAIGAVYDEPDGAWLELRGWPLWTDGRDSGLPQRYARVRVAAVRLLSSAPDEPAAGPSQP